MINPEELKRILIENIKFDLRHKHYDRTVKLAKFYKAIVTGKGQDELVYCYKERETEEQKKGRVKITRTLTKYVSQQIIKYFKKLRRVDNVRFDLGISKKESPNDYDELNNIVTNWKDENDLVSTIFDDVEYWAIVDPNAIRITDYKAKKGIETIEEIKPYSVVYGSDCIYNYKKENGSLEWVVICQKEEEFAIVKDRIVTEMIDHYYIFSAGHSIEMIEYRNKRPDREGTEQEINRNSNDPTRIHSNGSKKFLLVTNKTGSKEFPAAFVGAYQDYSTQKELFVSPLEDAREIFLDLINAKSEFDLTKYLHTFLQKYAVAPPCEYVDPDTHQRCDCGTLKGDDGAIACPSCKGSGIDVHYSASDIILFKMPEKDNYIPFKDLMGYVDLPEWLPKWQDEHIDKLLKRVSIAIFNTEVFTMPSFEKTATASVIELKKTYDTLHPYSNLVSRIVKKTIRLCSDYLSFSERAKPIHAFPQDYKFNTLAELIAMYESAKNAGVSYTVLWAIQCDILNKLYANDSTQVEKVKAEQQHKAFTDKQPEEVVFIISGRSKTDSDRILWENFDKIFKTIHNNIAQTEAKYFHLLPIDKQQDLINEEVEAIRVELTPTEDEPTQPFREE